VVQNQQGVLEPNVFTCPFCSLAATPPGSDPVQGGRLRRLVLAATLAAAAAAAASAVISLSSSTALGHALPGLRASSAPEVPRSNDHRRRRLEAVDFDVGFTELKRWKDEHGDLLVPQSTVVNAGGGQQINLGRW